MHQYKDFDFDIMKRFECKFEGGLQSKKKKRIAYVLLAIHFFNYYDTKLCWTQICCLLNYSYYFFFLFLSILLSHRLQQHSWAIAYTPCSTYYWKLGVSLSFHKNGVSKEKYIFNRAIIRWYMDTFFPDRFFILLI